MFHFGPLTFDGTINVPTLIVIIGVSVRIYNKLHTWYKEIKYKIDTMWEQFLIEHPEHERRDYKRLGTN